MSYSESPEFIPRPADAYLPSPRFTIDPVLQQRRLRRMRIRGYLCRIDLNEDTRNRIAIVEAALDDGPFFTHAQRQYILKTHGTRILRSHSLAFTAYKRYLERPMVSRTHTHIHYLV
jgi:hypothetical protein